jgi:dGTPase
MTSAGSAMPNTFYSAFDTAQLEPRRSSPEEHRTPFQIDRDRILHSSALRRLQGKTQVFYSFLDVDDDFYRTRLTHSLEVAQIGRSICSWLEKTSDLLKGDSHLDGDLVEAACLAHDLGHPPFGHTGERALHRLMQDFGGFEGNAQTMRQLTVTIFAESKGGMNPTRAFLDAVCKYKTLRSIAPEAQNHYLYDDQEPFLDFVLGGKKFPETLTPDERNAFQSLECQIMDWADDTAYSINDLADAVKSGYISVAKLETWAAKQKLNAEENAHVDFLIKAVIEGRIESRLGRSIGQHIGACSLRKRSNILSDQSRRYELELVVDEAVRMKAALNKRIACELVFNTPQLQQLDFKASHVLERLFEALHDRYIQRPAKHGMHLLPVNVEQQIEQTETKEQRARLVCDWLANMTESFAFRTYRRLFDPGFGSFRDFV